MQEKLWKTEERHSPPLGFIETVKDIPLVMQKQLFALKYSFADIY
jgi:hypothetical protein